MRSTIKRDSKGVKDILQTIDSALGEQFDKIKKFVKGTTAKVANLPQIF